MTDASIIYKVIIRFQQEMGQKAESVMKKVNQQSTLMGKAVFKLNNMFKTSAVRLFSLLFIMRRMRDAVAGLLKPAADMSGIFDILNMTLGLFFLPIMMALLPHIIDLANWFISMPDSVKMIVGILTLLVVILLSVGGAIVTVLIGLAALSSGSVVAGAAILASFLPVILAIVGVGILLVALAYIWSSSGSTATKVMASIFAAFVTLAVFMQGTMFTVLTKILSSFGMLGTVGLGSVALLMGAVLAVILMLFLLKDKFGSFGDALKAWVSGIVLAITFIIQSVAGGILTLIQFVLAAIANLAQMAANAARNAGFDWIANKLQSVANALSSAASYKLDLMTPTAEALDKYGFNPQPIASQSGVGGTQLSNLLANQSSPSPQATVIQNNTFNVADWQQYQTKMAEQQRKIEQDIKRQLAATQT